MEHITPSKKHTRIFFNIIVAIILCYSAFFRLYHLSLPNEKVFDEVYFPVFANDYITHTDFYDSHPPLGKLIIAGSIMLFGNNTFGWRFINAVTGLLLLWVVLRFTFDLTKSRRSALLALLLVAIEPMALVESRTGLINIYLALFSLLGLWLFWKWWREKEHCFSHYFWALVFFACASAVKWIGIGALGAAVFFYLIMAIFTKEHINLTARHWLALLVIPVVYTLTFIPDLIQTQSPLWDHFRWWHVSSWGYHAHLVATHPYGSSWWSWALMLRPIWLYYKGDNGIVTGIVEIGNVFTWVAGLGALLIASLQLWKENTETKQRNLFLILTYLALYLPWIFISRVKFIYHYFVPVLILLILLAIILDEKFLRRPERRTGAIVFLLVAGAFFVYFLPLLMGIPITQEFYLHHMWLRSWI